MWPLRNIPETEYSNEWHRPVVSLTEIWKIATKNNNHKSVFIAAGFLKKETTTTIFKKYFKQMSETVKLIDRTQPARLKKVLKVLLLIISGRHPVETTATAFLCRHHSQDFILHFKTM